MWFFFYCGCCCCSCCCFVFMATIIWTRSQPKTLGLTHLNSLFHLIASKSMWYSHHILYMFHVYIHLKEFVFILHHSLLLLSFSFCFGLCQAISWQWGRANEQQCKNCVVRWNGKSKCDREPEQINERTNEQMNELRGDVETKAGDTRTIPVRVHLRWIPNKMRNDTSKRRNEITRREEEERAPNENTSFDMEFFSYHALTLTDGTKVEYWNRQHG